MHYFAEYYTCLYKTNCVLPLIPAILSTALGDIFLATIFNHFTLSVLKNQHLSTACAQKLIYS